MEVIPQHMKSGCRYELQMKLELAPLNCKIYNLSKGKQALIMMVHAIYGYRLQKSMTFQKKSYQKRS